MIIDMQFAPSERDFEFAESFFESAKELDERAKRQGFYPELFDVCAMCPDRECCCGDECRPLD